MLGGRCKAVECAFDVNAMDLPNETAKGVFETGVPKVKSPPRGPTVEQITSQRP